MVARSFGRGVPRRRLLRTAGVTGTLGLAGCLDDGESSGDDGENPAPEATRTWLGCVASREGQRLFNAARGSVPTRTDVETNDFGPYFSTAIREYETAAARVPSISHGLAVTPEQLSDTKPVVAEHFAGPFDVESTAQGLMDAARTKR